MTADRTIHPDASEARNLVDDDCDGLVDEDFVLEGAVLVSEIMIDPAAANDATGEWFELYNASEFTIDLVGWVLSADDGDEITISRSLVIAYGARVVLGVSDDVAVNGGLAVDYVYDRSTFDLADDTDSIFLSVADRPIFDLTWTSTWPAGEGASLNLDPYYHERIDAQMKSSWCLSIARFGSGDSGTPAGDNEWCADFDRDGDLLSTAGGDCDDLDATVGPGSLETWDGIDDDCNGVTDDVTNDAADASFIGDALDQLGYETGLGVGDWSGDGVPDLVVGGMYVGDEAIGGFAVIDSTAALGAAGDSAWALATASIAGHESYAYLGGIDPELGDNNGDGRSDVVVAGASAAELGTTIGGWFDGTLLTGALSIDDAGITFANNAGLVSMTVESHLDFDGDGTDDILFGDWDREFGQVDAFLSGSLVPGTAYQLDTDDDFTLTSDEVGDHPGTVIGGADLDTDGYDDLLIGASGSDADADNGGTIYVVSGVGGLSGSGEIGFAAARRIRGDVATAFLGEHGTPQIVDFDDDGTLDVAVSSNEENTVWVFHDFGSATGDVFASAADVTITGSGVPNELGIGLASGDVDADGATDLLIGASDGESVGGANDPGATYLFLGRSLLGPLTTADADLTIDSTADDESGMLVAAADFDGDDKADVVSVAPGHLTDQGRVSIFLSP